MTSSEQIDEIVKRAESLMEKRREAPPMLFTNAPEHWPRMRGLHFRKEAHVAARTSILEAQVFGAFAGAKTDRFDIARLAASHLLDGGELYYSCQVNDDGKLTPVAVYPEGHPQASAHFAGLCEAARQAGLAPPVYYSQVAMQRTLPLNVLRPLGPLSFHHTNATLEKGQYAMWWTTPDDPDITTSPCRVFLDTYNESIDGYQSYWLAWFLTNLGVVKSAQRVALPAQGFSTTLRGPEERPVILSASAEKGVRFHLHAGTTPQAYRDRFFRHLGEAAKGMRRELERVGAPKDPENGHSPLRAWQMMRDPLPAVDGKPFKLNAAAVFIIQ